MPLEQLCLRVKVLFEGQSDSIAQTLAKAMEPPSAEAVEQALTALVQMGAIDRPAAGAGGTESLTPLGRHLAMLPTDVRIGKLILVGAMLGVLDPVLTIAVRRARESPLGLPRQRDGRRQY